MTANAPRIQRIAHTLQDLDDAAIEREFLEMSEDDRWLLLFAVIRENRNKITGLEDSVESLRPLWVRTIERIALAIGGGLAVVLGQQGADLR